MFVLSQFDGSSQDGDAAAASELVDPRYRAEARSAQTAALMRQAQQQTALVQQRLAAVKQAVANSQHNKARAHL